MTADVPEELVQKIFKQFDLNGDGKISPTEIAETLRSLGSTNIDEIQPKMAAIDSDGDGFIDYNELLTFCKANPDLAKHVASMF